MDHVNDNIDRLSQRVAKLLSEERIERNYSLRKVHECLPIKIAISTLHHYETKGASPEAIRILSLFRWYGLTLGQIFSDQSPPKQMLTELWDDDSFRKLCIKLYGVNPTRRKDILAALAKLIFTIGQSDQD